MDREQGLLHDVVQPGDLPETVSRAYILAVAESIVNRVAYAWPSPACARIIRACLLFLLRRHRDRRTAYTNHDAYVVLRQRRRRWLHSWP